MARQHRLQAPNCFYHITSRGDDRKKIFLNETDYRKFLEYLKKAKEKYSFYLYAYCLMGNHYHLFLEISQVNLSKIMQYLNTAYTVYYNTKHKRLGHLFQGRFKSILVEADSYFAELTRYIHLNPVRAGMADSPEQYLWSSYKAYLSNEPNGLIDREKGKELLAMDSATYRHFILSGIKDQKDPFKKVYAGCILGGAAFIKDTLKQLQAEVESKDFAYKRAVKNTVDPQELIAAVADYFKLDTKQMCQSRSRPMTAKRTAIYLLRRKTGLTNAQIGELFDMKSAAVSKAAISFELEMKKERALIKAVEQISSKVEV